MLLHTRAVSSKAGLLRAVMRAAEKKSGGTSAGAAGKAPSRGFSAATSRTATFLQPLRRLRVPLAENKLPLFSLETYRPSLKADAELYSTSSEARANSSTRSSSSAASSSSSNVRLPRGAAATHYRPSSLERLDALSNRNELQAADLSNRWDKMRLAWLVTGSTDITQWPQPSPPEPTSPSFSGSSSDSEGSPTLVGTGAGSSFSHSDESEDHGPHATEALERAIDRLASSSSTTTAGAGAGAAAAREGEGAAESASGAEAHVVGGAVVTDHSHDDGTSPPSGGYSLSSGSGHTSSGGSISSSADDKAKTASSRRRGGKLVPALATEPVPSTHASDDKGADKQQLPLLLRLNAGDLSDEELHLLFVDLMERRKHRKVKRPRVYVEGIRAALTADPDAVVKFTKPLPLQVMMDILNDIWGTDNREI
jgi:hypothetical protein